MEMIKALKILASSTEEQKDYLKKLGTYPSTDELAIEFDDGYRLFEDGLNMNESQKYTTNTLEGIKKINTILDNLSDKGDTSDWHVDALENEDWKEIRQLAETAMNSISL